MLDQKLWKKMRDKMYTKWKSLMEFRFAPRDSM